MRLSDENLRGRTAIAADGQAIGEVSALFLDSDAWRVESFGLSCAKTSPTSLAPRAASFMPARSNCRCGWLSVGDAVVLSAPAPELRQILPALGDSSPGH